MSDAGDVSPLFWHKEALRAPPALLAVFKAPLPPPAISTKLGVGRAGRDGPSAQSAVGFSGTLPLWPIETEERRRGAGPRGKPGRGARPSSGLSAYSSLRRFSFPSEPCGRRSISRGGAGAGWSEEPGSPSSRGVAWPPGGVGCVGRRKLGARGRESGPGGGGRGVEAPSPEGAGVQARSILGSPRESSSSGRRARAR